MLTTRPIKLSLLLAIELGPAKGLIFGSSTFSSFSFGKSSFSSIREEIIGESLILI
jgi:hypothetical protein